MDKPKERIGREFGSLADELFAVSDFLLENPAVMPLRQIATCLSVIMNLSQNQIQYTVGNPCRGEVQTLDLGW